MWSIECKRADWCSNRICMFNPDAVIGNFKMSEHSVITRCIQALFVKGDTWHWTFSHWHCHLAWGLRWKHTKFRLNHTSQQEQNDEQETLKLQKGLLSRLCNWSTHKSGSKLNSLQDLHIPDISAPAGGSLPDGLALPSLEYALIARGLGVKIVNTRNVSPST